MTPPLTHPAWCSPAHCDAVAGEGLPLTGTAHRSGPLDIDLGPYLPIPLRKFTARLHQAVAPWPVDVFVVVTGPDGHEVLSMRVCAARALLGVLDRLLAQAEETVYATVQPPADVPPGSIVGARPRHCRKCGHARVDGFHGRPDGTSAYRCQTCGHEWTELGPGRVAVLEPVDVLVVAGGIPADQCRACNSGGEPVELVDANIGWRCTACGRRWSTPSVPADERPGGEQ